jgi:hypothetical protein
MEALSGAVEAHPAWGHEGSPWDLEAHPEASPWDLESSPYRHEGSNRAMKVQPGAMEAQPGAMWKPKELRNSLRATEMHPRAMKNYLGSDEAPL